jgi:hypothetical protein
MGTPSLARLFDSLSANRLGWCIRLPAKLGAVFGLQIDLVFQTRMTVEDNPPPPVRDSEKELAHVILRNLAPSLREAEHQFKGYNPELLDPAQHVIGPYILIDRLNIQDNGEHLWSIVFPAKGDPSFRWNVEFDGTDCQGIWAGD